jgi:hypothetical protein
VLHLGHPGDRRQDITDALAVPKERRAGKRPVQQASDATRQHDEMDGPQCHMTDRIV